MRNRHGFTLFELMLVMALMVIIASLAIPLMFEGMDGETRVQASADLVRAHWADCRTLAIEECRPYRFAVIPNSGKFKIEPYTGTLQNMAIVAPDNSGGGGTSNTPGGVDDNAPGYVLEDRLPRGVRFGTKDVKVDGDSSEGSGDYVTVAIFMPMGNAYDDADVTFGSKGSSMVTLHLRALTGAATTTRPKMGDDSK